MSEVNCALRKCPCRGKLCRFNNTATSKQKSICSTINFRIDHVYLLLNLQCKTVFLDTPQGMLILFVNFMNLWCSMMLYLYPISGRSPALPEISTMMRCRKISYGVTRWTENSRGMTEGTVKRDSKAPRKQRTKHVIHWLKYSFSDKN